MTRGELATAVDQDQHFWTPHLLSLDKHISLTSDDYLLSDNDSVIQKCLEYARSL